MTFLIASIENNDAINLYMLEVNTSAKHHQDVMPCSAEHNTPRYALKYISQAVTIIVVITCFITTMSYRNFLHLLCITNSVHPNTKLWRSPDFVGAYLIEMFISVLHPACYIKGVNFCTFPQLYFVCLLRIPLLVRQFYLKSPLLNSTTNEVIACLNDIHMTNASADNIATAVKIADKKWSYQIFIFQTFIIWWLAAWLLSLAEATHGLHSCQLENMVYKVEDMFWLISVTIMTIGYGDIYPKSFTGRCICICVGFYGLIMSARIVILHVNRTKMTKRERIVYNNVLIRQLQEEKRTKAAIFIQTYWRHNKYMEKLKLEKNLRLNEMTEKNMRCNDRRMLEIYDNNPREDCRFSRHGKVEVRKCSLAMTTTTLHTTERSEVKDSLTCERKDSSQMKTNVTIRVENDNYSKKVIRQRSSFLRTATALNEQHSHSPCCAKGKRIPSINLDACTKCPTLITNFNVLKAMVQFKKARLAAKYQLSDDFDLLDVGIKLEAVEGQVNNIEIKLDKILEVIERIELKQDAAAKNFGSPKKVEI